MRHAVSKLAGVGAVSVDLDRGLIEVELAGGNAVVPAELRGAIRRCGFDPREIDVRASGQLVTAATFAVAGTSLRVRVSPTGAVPEGPVVVEGTLDRSDATLTVRSATRVSP